MVRRSLVLALALAAFTGCRGPTDPLDLVTRDGEGVLGAWVHSGFFNRTYYLHTPPGMKEDGSYPLLIVLHGAGDTGASFHARIDPDRDTDAAGLVTVFPDGIGNTWTVGCGPCTPAGARGANDVVFLRTLVRHLAEGLPVDTTRVFVVGFSQGGQLAQLYGCRSESPPAGIASVAGLLSRGVAGDCAPAGPFPVAFVHGDRDPVMSYYGFGPAAGVLSLPESVDVWLGLMRCDPTPDESMSPDRVGDGTRVLVRRYAGCDGGGPVEVHTVEGGGHTWPGRTGPWPLFTGRHSRNLDTTARLVDLLLSG